MNRIHQAGIMDGQFHLKVNAFAAKNINCRIKIKRLETTTAIGEIPNLPLKNDYDNSLFNPTYVISEN